MLTREILAANAQLSGLTEEQIKAIITLSENDENSVIAKKTGEIYGALEWNGKDIRLRKACHVSNESRCRSRNGL